MFLGLRIVTGFALASSVALPANAGDLKLTINRVRSTAGQLIIGCTDVGMNTLASGVGFSLGSDVVTVTRTVPRNRLLALSRSFWRGFDGIAGA